ncbi:MAG: hypothetical protein HY366_00470 [Candidatus Aenigmarchaeota archaeon]|nr:hypothetical protein [Candidatus Aenigmarchaeota archaeon]
MNVYWGPALKNYTLGKEIFALLKEVDDEERTSENVFEELRRRYPDYTTQLKARQCVTDLEAGQFTKTTRRGYIKILRGFPPETPKPVAEETVFAQIGTFV